MVSATTVDAYVAELPADRQEAIMQLRNVIRKNLPKGFEEVMNYGMIGYVVPHSRYPAGYHCNTRDPLPFMNIASQKNSVNIYHMGLYASAPLLEWFTSNHAKVATRKLDMGKSCIRYKKTDDIPYSLIGELASKMTVDEWIALYEAAFRNKK